MRVHCRDLLRPSNAIDVNRSLYNVWFETLHHRVIPCTRIFAALTDTNTYTTVVRVDVFEDEMAI